MYILVHTDFELVQRPFTSNAMVGVPKSVHSLLFGHLVSWNLSEDVALLVFGDTLGLWHLLVPILYVDTDQSKDAIKRLDGVHDVVFRMETMASAVAFRSVRSGSLRRPTCRERIPEASKLDQRVGSHHLQAQE